jgi:NitT/TauT family transport system substrate-binding protein
MNHRLTRRNALVTVAGAAIWAARPRRASAKPMMTYATLLDPSQDAVMYGIKAGKVKSDILDIEVHPLGLPAIIQATATKQYDVLQGASISIPRALDQGLKLTILSTALRFRTAGQAIWVKADSPYKSVRDLKGKTLGVYAINSTGITLLRIAVWKKYGLNVNLQGGDLKWVELPAAGLPGALSTGKIDAAAFIQSQDYNAGKTGEFRQLTLTAQDLYDLYKLHFVTGVNTGYPEKIDAQQSLYVEFCRMMKATADYARTHLDEISQIVGESSKEDPNYFKAWFTKYDEAPMVITNDDIKAIRTTWQLSKELGILDDYPDPATVVWSKALRR